MLKEKYARLVTGDDGYEPSLIGHLHDVPASQPLHWMVQKAEGLLLVQSVSLRQELKGILVIQPP